MRAYQLHSVMSQGKVYRHRFKLGSQRDIWKGRKEVVFCDFLPFSFAEVKLLFMMHWFWVQDVRFILTHFLAQVDSFGRDLRKSLARVLSWLKKTKNGRMKMNLLDLWLMRFCIGFMKNMRNLRNLKVNFQVKRNRQQLRFQHLSSLMLMWTFQLSLENCFFLRLSLNILSLCRPFW